MGKLKENEPQNNKSIKNFFVKLFNCIYRISIYILLLNSIWYFIRLLVFGRKISIGLFDEFYHILLLFNLVLGIIAINKLHENRKEFKKLKSILKILFIIYTFFSVTAIIHRTYFDYAMSVQPYWDSGEWTF